MELRTQGSTALDALADRVRPLTLAAAERLPASEAVASLLPHGLPRGATVAVESATAGGGATSLALTLAAGPSQAGSWAAVVGAPDLGLVAAAELGVSLERLVVVDLPPGGQGAILVAALVDGFDLVLMGPAALALVGRRDGRRLEARVRERRGVLVGLGGDLPGVPARVRLRIVASEWDGLDRGAGHLRSRRMTVEATGRGPEARPRRAQLHLPGPDPRDPHAEPGTETGPTFRLGLRAVGSR